MAVRRKHVNKRLDLIRKCGCCGKEFTTTADTPFLRSIVVLDNIGKKHQMSTYYCSHTCFLSSYKYDMFANQIDKKKRRDAKRVGTDKMRQKNRRYYLAHRDERIAYARQYRKDHYEQCLEAVRYNRQKNKLMKGDDCGGRETDVC